MALDRTVFLREMAVLAELFNRPTLSEVLIGRYHEYLSSRLTTEEFEAAARRVFEEERYWPAPVTFVLAVKGDPKAASEEAWNQLLAAAAKGHAPTPEAITTLRALGLTFREVSTATEYQLTQISRRFRAHHERGHDQQLTLEHTNELELQP